MADVREVINYSRMFPLIQPTKIFSFYYVLDFVSFIDSYILSLRYLSISNGQRRSYSPLRLVYVSTGASIHGA